MITARIREWVKSDAPPDEARLPWELALARVWPRALLLSYVPVALFTAFWGSFHASQLDQLVEGAYDTRSADLAGAKTTLVRLLIGALPFSLFAFFAELFRERRRMSAWDLRWTALPIALTGLPLLSARLIEYQHPYLTGLVIAGLSVSVALFAGWLPFELRLDAKKRRQLALGLVGLGCAVFTIWLGFMAHWRFITFHAEPYDMSWETNAVHNIVHSGIPKTSVGAGSYYDKELLPAPYAALHTPWIYYLYAPFYALFQDGRTLLWLQAFVTALGAVGVFAFARKKLRSDLSGASMALLYLLMPHVQVYCLHDLHANQMAIPFALLALGAMESGYKRTAFALALVTCICREETAVYGIAIGIFWATAKRDLSRARWGWVTAAVSLAVLLVITRLVMPLGGGKPRYEHFGYFFGKPGVGSLLESYLLNPWGALSILLTSPRPEYLWFSLLPMAFLPLVGWRGAVFLLIPAGLLFPAGVSAFFVVGINYGAPIVLPMVVMGVFGMRWLHAKVYRRVRDLKRARLMCALGVLTCGLCASVLYGNLFAKTYKLEFGSVPYRQSNQYGQGTEVGMLAKLPPFGERERLLWDVINHVPRGVPISTSWRINPQLSNREVSLIYPQIGAGHPRQNRAQYVVIDRLPSLIEQPEEWERQLRASGKYDVFYENASGVIFKHKRDK